MVDLTRVAKGLVYYMLGTLASIVIYWIIPIVMSAFTSNDWQWTGETTTLYLIIWFAMILAWVALMIILPAATIIQAIQQSEENINILNKFIAIMLMITGILITIIGWYWIPALTNAMPNALMRYIFYTGLLVNWGGGIIIAPLIKLSTKG